MRNFKKWGEGSWYPSNGKDDFEIGELIPLFRICSWAIMNIAQEDDSNIFELLQNLGKNIF